MFRLSPKRVTRALLIVAGLLVLAEVGLRFAGSLYLTSFYRQQFEAQSEVETINIVCLGESSTAGLWVDWSDSYPKQLERMLREFYGTPRIRVIVPAHVGQNSSQVSNRIADYIRLYRPRLVVAMVGYNNEWSLAESHIGQFIQASAAHAWRVKGMIALDGIRLYKVMRYGYNALFSESGVTPREGLNILGHPELVRYPPEDWVYSFARSNQKAFVELWKHDVRHIVQEARQHDVDVKVVLMTYHINPTYLSSGEFVSLANTEGIPLVRNDVTFAKIRERGALSRYLLHDHWHPNRFGYTVIANNALREIAGRDLLKLGAGLRPELTRAITSLPDAEEFPRYPNQGIDFGASEVQRFLGDGWSGPEGAFRWTDDLKAEVLFALGGLDYDTLELKLRPFIAPGRVRRQRVLMTLNGKSVANLNLTDPSPQTHQFRLPSGTLVESNVLRFELPDAQSPAASEVSDDARRLGIAVESVRLSRTSK